MLECQSAGVFLHGILVVVDRDVVYIKRSYRIYAVNRLAS